VVLARGRAQAGARAPLHPLTRRRHAASLGPHAGRVRLIEMTVGVPGCVPGFEGIPRLILISDGLPRSFSGNPAEMNLALAAIGP